MQVLLCAATAFEIQPTIDFIEGRGLQDQVGVTISGVGLVAATYALTKVISAQSPTLVLQGGIAGSFDHSIPLGTAVAVKEERLGHLGVHEGGGFQTIFDLKLADPDEAPWTNGTLQNPHDTLLESLGLPLVNAVSVQEISTDPNRIEHLKTSAAVHIETMEGAALHYTALMEGMPFAQIRTISNYVGERDKKAWRIGDAIQKLNEQLQIILIKILNL